MGNTQYPAYPHTAVAIATAKLSAVAHFFEQEKENARLIGGGGGGSFGQGVPKVTYGEICVYFWFWAPCVCSPSYLQTLHEEEGEAEWGTGGGGGEFN